MSLDFLETVRRIIAEVAVDRKMCNIPQLQIPTVEFVVPRGTDPDSLLEEMRKRLSIMPSAGVRLMKKGTQYRIKIGYLT
jgi:hypothetical protein